MEKEHRHGDSIDVATAYFVAQGVDKALRVPDRIGIGETVVTPARYRSERAAVLRADNNLVVRPEAAGNGEGGAVVAVGDENFHAVRARPLWMCRTAAGGDARRHEC